MRYAAGQLQVHHHGYMLYVILLHQRQCVHHLAVLVYGHQPAATQATYQVTHGIHFQEATVHHPFVIVYLGHIAAAVVVKYHHYHIVLFQLVLHLA